MPSASFVQRFHHKIVFEEAKSVFSDEFGLLIVDPDHSEEEDRFILLGMNSSLNLLVVGHCYREVQSDLPLTDDEEESEIELGNAAQGQAETGETRQVIRIYSARKATKTESKSYRRK
jgi:uncharacterized protein